MLYGFYRYAMIFWYICLKFGSSIPRVMDIHGISENYKKIFPLLRK